MLGCIPIVVTPFDESFAVDERSLRAQVDFLIEAGVHGLATPAIASEGYKLTDAERDRVIRVVIEAANGRVPVIASADGNGTDVAVARARSAAACGASALMVLPPMFVKPDPAGVENYYLRVADAGGVPVMVQDAPQLTGYAIGVDSLERMFAANPLISSVKLEGLPSGGKTAAVIARLGGAMTVFAGWGGLSFWEGLQRGASGCMPAANLGPALTAVYELFMSGHVDEAAIAFDRTVPLVSWSMQSIDLSIWCAKESLVRAGVFRSATMREPATPPDEVMRAEFARLHQAAGLDVGDTWRR
jgi:4-hydroxy-tetrahydrodipicolinate synthase